MENAAAHASAPLEWRRLWESLLPQLPVGVVLLEDGCIRETNPAFETLSGFGAADLRGRPLASLVTDSPPGEAGDGEWAWPADEEARGGGDRCLRTRAGALRPVRIAPDLPAIHRPGWRPVVVQDLTERRTMDQERLKNRQLASLAALSGGIAHDYNNLLTAIMGNISLVMTYLDPGDHLHGLLDQAQQASLVARELTNRLITFSRGGAPVKEIVRLAPLIEGAVAFALSGSSVTVDFSIPDDSWCIAADHAQMTQALHHLVINAREAMPQGGQIQVDVAHLEAPPAERARGGGDAVRIRIRDEGQGMPPEILERIFDPYFSTKTKGDQKGQGLGLSIAESIVKRHGGRIGVSSQVGKGSCFTIDLPVVREPADPRRVEAPAPEPALGRRSGTVLVMDDEAMIRDLAVHLLQRLGYEAHTARDGEEALALYARALERGRPYDAVILDITVRGGMGGKEAIRGLRDLDPRVRAIVSSGYADDPGVINYREHGFCGVVAKPYRIQELARQLAQIAG